VSAPATECPRISKVCEFVQNFEGLFDMELVDKAFEDY
jgi:hypothetical protein